MANGVSISEFRSNRVAHIQPEAGATATSRECTIGDISGRGARLFVNDDETPERFFLHIGGETPMRQECRMVWRLGGEVGVEFVAGGSDQWRLNVIKRIRGRRGTDLSVRRPHKLMPNCADGDWVL